MSLKAPANYIMRQHSYIHIIRGTTSSLLSAPHAAPIIKRGWGGGYIKPREKHTEEVVRRVCNETGAWGISTNAGGVIKNWDPYLYNKYRLLVRDIISTHNITLFIDIHGAHKSRPFLVDYDFIIPLSSAPHAHDAVIHAAIRAKLLERFPKEKISKGFFRSFNGSGRHTLTYHVRKRCAIPAIQFELNRTVRAHSGMTQDFIYSLSSAITYYENTFAGVRQKRKKGLRSHKTA